MDYQYMEMYDLFHEKQAIFDMLWKYSLVPQPCLFAGICWKDVHGVTQTVVCLAKRILFSFPQVKRIWRFMYDVWLLHFFSYSCVFCMASWFDLNRQFFLESLASGIFAQWVYKHVGTGDRIASCSTGGSVPRPCPPTRCHELATNSTS